MASSSFKDYFSDAAVGYAAYRPTYPRQLVEFIAGLVPGALAVWEAGCGSGQLSALLGERFAHVVATDASADQIANAVQHPHVEYRVARAEATGLPDASADLAVVAQAVHWFDLDAYYSEVRRIVRPGGGIVLVSYDTLHTDAEIDPIIRAFYQRTLGKFWPKERWIVEDQYRSLAFPFAEVSVPALQMTAEWDLDQLIGYIRTWSGLRAQVKAQGPAEYERFHAELLAAWKDPSQRRHIRWPLCVRAGKL